MQKFKMGHLTRYGMISVNERKKPMTVVTHKAPKKPTQVTIEKLFIHKRRHH